MFLGPLAKGFEDRFGNIANLERLAHRPIIACEMHARKFEKYPRHPATLSGRGPSWYSKIAPSRGDKG